MSEWQWKWVFQKIQFCLVESGWQCRAALMLLVPVCRLDAAENGRGCSVNHPSVEVRSAEPAQFHTFASRRFAFVVNCVLRIPYLKAPTLKPCSGL